jgi:aminoglycoside/choline kinase family phosphotransferase
MSNETSPRMTALHAWLLQQGVTDFEIAPATADASFRRYFRITTPAGTRIVMDAPPAFENCRPFVQVATLMREAGVNVPTVLAQDLDQGFLLLSDMGTKTYLDVLDESNVDALFRLAVDELVKWQLASRPGVLPAYERPQLANELALFPDWYLARHLQVELKPAQRAVLDKAFELIMDASLAQQNVYVHSDFMPRNLMLPEAAIGGRPGVLDFQDAVYGPISYDIASLYKDAFVSWDEERILDGTIRYWEKARKAGLPVPSDFGDFYRDVEWIGLQRHLRIIGIFARIHHRDGKPRYLADVPRFVGYVRKVCERYVALAPLHRLFDELEISDGVERTVGYTF